MASGLQSRALRRSHALANGKIAIVIRIPKSWNPSHQVSNAKDICNLAAFLVSDGASRKMEGSKEMSKIIEDLPPDVMGIEAAWKVTHEDYQYILIPRAEEMMAKGPIKMLYVIGAEFTGYELEALWDDSAFGVKHWHDFSHVAVVADQAWVRGLISMFKPFFPSEVRLFRLAALAAAKAWITSA
jgi:hypothetical protein